MWLVQCSDVGVRLAVRPRRLKDMLVKAVRRRSASPGSDPRQSVVLQQGGLRQNRPRGMVLHHLVRAVAGLVVAQRLRRVLHHHRAKLAPEAHIQPLLELAIAGQVVAGRLCVLDAQFQRDAAEWVALQECLHRWVVVVALRSIECLDGLLEVLDALLGPLVVNMQTPRQGTWEARGVVHIGGRVLPDEAGDNTLELVIQAVLEAQLGLDGQPGRLQVSGLARSRPAQGKLHPHRHFSQ